MFTEAKLKKIIKEYEEFVEKKDDNYTLAKDIEKLFQIADVSYQLSKYENSIKYLNLALEKIKSYQMKSLKSLYLVISVISTLKMVNLKVL
jgi:tetratricopeptide (TPR) repeat protein